jgi:hypothetical protein
MSSILPQKPAAGGKKYFRLTSEILARSVADSWHDAKLEWQLETVVMEPGGTCLCGKHPITDRCLIRNRENGNTAVVGNCCVTKVLPGLSSARIFAGFKRIMADVGAALNIPAIEYAYEHGWINDRERAFYLDTIRPAFRWRRLSDKQRVWREAINAKVLRYMAASGKGVDHA